MQKYKTGDTIKIVKTKTGWINNGNFHRNYYSLIGFVVHGAIGETDFFRYHGYWILFSSLMPCFNNSSFFGYLSDSEIVSSKALLTEKMNKTRKFSKIFGNVFGEYFVDFDEFTKIQKQKNSIKD